MRELKRGGVSPNRQAMSSENGRRKGQGDNKRSRAQARGETGKILTKRHPATGANCLKGDAAKEPAVVCISIGSNLASLPPLPFAHGENVDSKARFVVP
jgi:hypothetical protein